jgi:hypothetical protein
MRLRFGRYPFWVSLRLIPSQYKNTARYTAILDGIAQEQPGLLRQQKTRNINKHAGFKDGSGTLNTPSAPFYPP